MFQKVSGPPAVVANGAEKRPHNVSAGHSLSAARPFVGPAPECRGRQPLPGSPDCRPSSLKSWGLSGTVSSTAAHGSDFIRRRSSAMLD